VHLNYLSKMKARAASLIHRLSDDAAHTVMQMVSNAWSNAREQWDPSARCVFIWNRILQRCNSIGIMRCICIPCNHFNWRHFAPLCSDCLEQVTNPPPLENCISILEDVRHI
jgi:hypothetical protein